MNKPSVWIELHDLRQQRNNPLAWIQSDLLICEANSVDANVSEFNHRRVSAKPTPPSQLPDPDNLRDVLAYWVRLRRVDRGWSQERLALECELDRTYVSAVERSRWNVSLSNIERFAQALEVEAWTLLKPPSGCMGAGGESFVQGTREPETANKAARAGG